MAWIESHQGLGNHPKTKRLARKLGVSLPAAVGHLHFLWWWSMDYAPEGDLSKYDIFDIADAAEWGDDADLFVESLVWSGFLDETEDGYALHDWYDYAGKLIEFRKLQTQRTLRKRNLYDNSELTRMVKERDGNSCRYCGEKVNWKDRKGANGGTYDHVDPEGDNSIDNIVVACRSCNSKKGRHTPLEAGMRLLDISRSPADLSTGNLPEINTASAITIPNQPNRTINQINTATTMNPFRFFESEGFGTLSSVISDKLGDMVDTYGERWVIEAMRESVVHGVRKLSYVDGILKRYQSSGIDEPWTAEKPKQQKVVNHPNRSSKPQKPNMPVYQAPSGKLEGEEKEELARVLKYLEEGA